MAGIALSLLCLHASGQAPLVSPPAEDPRQLVEAQGEGPQGLDEPAQEPLWRFFEQTIDISVLIELATLRLGAHIEYDPSKVSGPVAVQQSAPYGDREIWGLLNREFVARGLTSVQPPGSPSFRVVPLGEAASLARLEAPDLAGAQAGYVKVMVALEHRKSEELAPVVQLLLSKPAGSVSPVRDGNALLVSDLRAHVEQVLSMLTLLDGPLAAPVIEEVPLAHTSAVELGALLERLTTTRKQVAGSALVGSALPLPDARSMLVVAPLEEMSWWRGTIEWFDRPEPVVTANYTPRRFGLAETARLLEQVVRGDSVGEAPRAWRLVTDELTGTLIVTTTPSRHREIERLLTRLEGTDPGPRRPLRTYPIRNRRVSEVLALLESLLEAGVLEQAAPKGEAPASQAAVQPVAQVQGPTAPIPGRTTGGSSPTRSKEPEVMLAADEGTSRILAFGEARLLDQLGPLIESLDVRHTQVLVEALVVNLSETQTRDLGVELQKFGSEDGTLYRLGSLFGLGSPDPSLGSIPALAGSGATAVVLDPGDFSALVRALETVNQGRSLTIPKVLVNNNQSATLDSVLQTPFVNVNASQTVATTSFGGTFDAGTSITFKPQIAEGDQILLDYQVSLSAFVGEAPDPVVPPPRQENRLQSVVTIPDGYTVVVGGLDIQRESEVESRVPWIGEVPLLGQLFKSRSKTESKTRFFVFLRCSVMRSGSFEDLRYASEPDLVTAGLDDGWPRLEPRIIR